MDEREEDVESGGMENMFETIENEHIDASSEALNSSSEEINDSMKSFYTSLVMILEEANDLRGRIAQSAQHVDGDIQRMCLEVKEKDRALQEVTKKCQELLQMSFAIGGGGLHLGVGTGAVGGCGEEDEDGHEGQERSGDPSKEDEKSDSLLIE